MRVCVCACVCYSGRMYNECMKAQLVRVLFAAGQQPGVQGGLFDRVQFPPPSPPHCAC